MVAGRVGNSPEKHSSKYAFLGQGVCGWVGGWDEDRVESQTLALKFVKTRHSSLYEASTKG